MTEQSIVQQFARLLALESDDAARARLLARAKMLALNEVPDSALEPPIRTLGEYLDTPIELPPSLVWPTIVVRGELTTTLGRAGKGKTTMNQNRIFKWAAGRPMFESFRDKDGQSFLRPDEPLKTLIIENEGAAGMFHHKVGLLMSKSGDLLTDEEKSLIRENVLIWGTGGYSGLKLDDPNTLAQVRAGVEKAEPDIVFIEPFRSLWRGEENSATEMAVVADNLVGMATDYNCGIILSHHERKTGAGDDGEKMSAGRGSTVLEGVVATMENFEAVKGGQYRELSWSKARYLQPPPTLRVEYDTDSGWYRHVRMDELEGAIIEALREAGGEALSIKALCEATQEPERRIRKATNDLTEAGRLKRNTTREGGGGYLFRLMESDEIDNGGLGL